MMVPLVTVVECRRDVHVCMTIVGGGVSTVLRPPGGFSLFSAWRFTEICFGIRDGFPRTSGGSSERDNTNHIGSQASVFVYVYICQCAVCGFGLCVCVCMLVNIIYKVAK